MSKYAVIRRGVIIHVFNWDGVSKHPFGDDVQKLPNTAMPRDWMGKPAADIPEKPSREDPRIDKFVSSETRNSTGPSSVRDP